jgi:hypothetical protein
MRFAIARQPPQRRDGRARKAIGSHLGNKGELIDAMRFVESSHIVEERRNYKLTETSTRRACESS